MPFKATAGLHHAVRNTDVETGFEQDGLLNLLVATGAALDGDTLDAVANVLAERDGGVLTEMAAGLSASVRDAFRSFGRCSVAEPVEELVALGLLSPSLMEDLS